MSDLGLRVGPFEITAPATVPEAGRWFVAQRVGTSSRGPSEVLIKRSADEERGGADLAKEFERLRDLHDRRVPEPVGFWEGACALAYARVQGLPLAVAVAAPEADRLAVGVVTWLEVVCDLAESIHRAHEHGLVHGHLDGAHVWVAPDGRLWLWGLGPGPREDAGPGWLSPERTLRLAPTAQTDQWSLGSMVLAVLGGAPPGDLGRLSDVDARMQPLLARWPGLARVLRKMLDPSPEHRYPSVQTARTELLAQMRQIGGVSERRALGAWAAERLGGTIVPAPPREEESDDEATVLVSPDRVSAELAALRRERDRVVSRTPVAEPTWPGVEAAHHDQEATMLFHDESHPHDGDVDTDLNRRLDHALLEDEDSLVRTMNRAAVPITGELREAPNRGAQPLDLPIDSPTAEKYSVPIYHDDEQSGPYHSAIDLTEIDTAPNEVSGEHRAVVLPPREMSGAERLASWMLAALAASTLVWALVRIAL